MDHFIPWARYPNDSLANYVVAHSKCNRDKRDHLAANSHVLNWAGRIQGENSKLSDLALIADERHWELGVEGSMGVVSAIYKHLQPEVELWKFGNEFEFANKSLLEGLFV